MAYAFPCWGLSTVGRYWNLGGLEANIRQAITRAFPIVLHWTPHFSGCQRWRTEYFWRLSAWNVVRFGRKLQHAHCRIPESSLYKGRVWKLAIPVWSKRHYDFHCNSPLPPPPRETEQHGLQSFMGRFQRALFLSSSGSRDLEARPNRHKVIPHTSLLKHFPETLVR